MYKVLMMDLWQLGASPERSSGLLRVAPVMRLASNGGKVWRWLFGALLLQLLQLLQVLLMLLLQLRLRLSSHCGLVIINIPPVFGAQKGGISRAFAYVRIFVYCK